MIPRFTACVAGAATAAALLFVPARANAYDSLATSCGDDPFFCQTGAVKFSKVDSLPIEWSFDTGWVPAGSPLQVHIWAGIYANTRIALAGSLVTSWPEVFVLEAPGDKNGGTLGFHYGAEFGAQASVHVTVLGKTFSWTGDIPYIPQFDFQVEGTKTFDAWAYAPGTTLSSTTNPQTLASIGIGDLIGGSIPGIDGGFELDVALELAATYTTTRLVVETTDGKEVKDGSITSPDGQASTPYLSGPSIELDVHPEGTVSYDGVVHIIPAFYIELLGNSWQIPIADIPISFPITDTDWIFDKQRVHVPLPDLVLPAQVIDFGAVEVGQKELLTYELWNAGEGAVSAAFSTSDPDLFNVYDPTLVIDPAGTKETAVRFTPKTPGQFEATLLIASNDPSDPVQTIILKGIARGGLYFPVDEEGTDQTGADSTDTGACACRTTGGTSPNDAPFGLAALAIGALAVRRRRRR